MSERGWWRRNRWGLVALLPALAAATAVNLHSAYDSYWNRKPREPIMVGDGGWVAFAGARIRLAELAPADDLKDSDRNAITPPEGTRVWRATIAFEASQPELLAGCQLRLEDDAGRTYEDTPRDLVMVSLRHASCVPDTSASQATATPAPSATTSYETMAFFITSSEARPVAVRIILRERLPAYARLPAG